MKISNRGYQSSFVITGGAGPSRRQARNRVYVQGPTDDPLRPLNRLPKVGYDCLWVLDTDGEPK
jgi:hypothetical protein